ncbi:MAG: hypothetical protein ACREQ7_04970 [Candidatus Binatia bacterium]
MFIENYYRESAESILAGGEAKPIPYPKISGDDWRVWSTILPFRAQQFDRFAAAGLASDRMRPFYGIPYAIGSEIERASAYFDKVEIWGKQDPTKDPIAVGLCGTDRYLIARWGMDKLIPFQQIKRSMPLVLAWKYMMGPMGVGLAGLSILGLILLS